MHILVKSISIPIMWVLLLMAFGPIPVDFHYTRPKRLLESLIPSARALQISTEAIHEWIGMLWYAIRC